MTDHSFMPQVEVLSVTDTGRRRRWTDAEKLRIVEESYSAPRMAAATARRHAISRSLLTRWRREARQGRLSAPESEMHFAPVAITAHADQRAETERGDTRSGRFEIILQNGRRLLADASLDASALTRLVQILERA